MTRTNGTKTVTVSDAAECVQTIPGYILAAAARGDVDLNALARQELASRGLDFNARWVGFPMANAIARGASVGGK